MVVGAVGTPVLGVKVHPGSAELHVELRLSKDYKLNKAEKETEREPERETERTHVTGVLNTCQAATG